MATATKQPATTKKKQTSVYFPSDVFREMAVYCAEHEISHSDYVVKLVTADLKLHLRDAL